LSGSVEGIESFIFGDTVGAELRFNMVATVLATGKIDVDDMVDVLMDMGHM
jgi:hypothetical protein